VAALMADNDELDRLRRRLRREAAGPLTDISNHATASLISVLGTLVQWIRRAGQERPLISLLVAFEAGFAVARLKRRHAKH
jgi:hypothetical protein